MYEVAVYEVAAYEVVVYKLAAIELVVVVIVVVNPCEGIEVTYGFGNVGGGILAWVALVLGNGFSILELREVGAKQ